MRAVVATVAFLMAAAATLWAAWAIAIPFEEGGGGLCIGTTADVAQQGVAVVGWLCAVAAVRAALRDEPRSWVYLTLAGGAMFGLWAIGTRIAANANC